jgi:glycosyltransferase involved in cell wall biosynthesis
LDRRNLFFLWQPSIFAILAPMMGCTLLYLCWGSPSGKQHGFAYTLKRAKLDLVLKLSRLVMVNDPITATEVLGVTGRNPVQLPHVVDSDFFSYSAWHGRDNFVVVPGDNDRDEALICELAARGLRIVRVARSARVAQIHSSPGNGVTVRHRASYVELKRLYQSAMAVLLPLTSSNHVAGQTAVLEAMACGAPVVISQGRTGATLKNVPSVLFSGSRSPDEWMDLIAQLARRGRDDPRFTEPAASLVRDQHHPDAVGRHLSGILSQAMQ